MEEITNIRLKRGILCPVDECLETLPYQKEVRSHLVNVHKINIELEVLEFSSFEDFKIWKENFEKGTNSSYIKNGSTRSSVSGYEVTYFQCHRSRRRLKSTESNFTRNKKSNKLNPFCPSCIELYIYKKEVTVNLYRTHYGHEIDVCHLSLPEARKGEVPGKMEEMTNISLEKGIPCPVDKCLETFPYQKEVRSHLVNVHKINIEVEVLAFSSFEDFKIWKENFEKRTNSSYLKIGSTRLLASGYKVTHFQCHRSRRKQKITESNFTRNKSSYKLNPFCPSYIELNMYKKEVTVNLYKTHYGHEIDECHLPLPEVIKAEVLDVTKAEISELTNNLCIDEYNSDEVQEEEVEFSSTAFARKNVHHTHILEKDDLFIKWALIKAMLESKSLTSKECLEIGKKMDSIMQIFCKKEKENFEERINTGNTKTPKQLLVVTPRKRKFLSEIDMHIEQNSKQ